MTTHEVPPPLVKSGLYKVVVEIEEPMEGDNGQLLKRRLQLHRHQPRGTAEHLAKMCMRDGVRLDAHEGVRFISPFRIREVRIMRDEEDWT